MEMIKDGNDFKLKLGTVKMNIDMAPKPGRNQATKADIEPHRKLKVQIETERLNLSRVFTSDVYLGFV